MSERAYRQAIVAQLRTAVAGGGCGFDQRNCDEGPPDGQPPPNCGKFFVSVFMGGVGSVQEGCCEEEFNGRITISHRIDVPWDRIAMKTIQDTLEGVNDRCGTIRAVMLNEQYTVMNAANVIINAMTGGPWDGFVEPFFRVEYDEGELVSGGWFHAEEDKAAAVRKSIRLYGAKRIQKLGNVA